ncbi:hypothetical protein G9A89_016990 [Geosiphon pyriformis]|nr:hypothetical protein G9A89_016990 [Geosiphon pyriformis]
MSNDESVLGLLFSKFVSSNQLLPARSHVVGKYSFEPVKSFALDVELSVSLKKAKELAVSKKILVNIDVRKPNICSDWEVIVKKISVDLSRLVIESVFSKFSQVISIRMQLIGLWQKALVEFESSNMASLVASKWFVLVVVRDYHWALLYTFPVGTTVHDLSDLVTSYNEKTCFIGHNPSSYTHNRCAVVCFDNEASKLAAIGSVSVYRGYKQFGHISDICSIDQIHLTGIYKKKQAPIACLVFFGVFSSVPFGSGPSFVAETSLFTSALPSDHSVYDCLASLECSMKLLADQVSGILEKLDSMKLVPMMTTSNAFSTVVPVSAVSGSDSNMVLDSALVISNSTPPVISDTAFVISLSSSKVLTTKISGLESKIVALEVLVESVLEKLDYFVLVWKVAMCNIRGMNNPAKQDDIAHPWLVNKFDDVCVFSSGLDSGYVGASVAIVINRSLARHVYKVSKILSYLLCIRLLFKNKLLVSILGLYTSASLATQFSQADEINFLIAKAVNESSFVILGGDFNKDGSRKCASFKRCHDLGLSNSWGVSKTIDYVFISSNLVNTIMQYGVFVVSEHFDMDHRAVSKFNFKGADKAKWDNFKHSMLANTAMFLGEFTASVRFSDLDTMWCVVHKIMTLLANKIFKKKWFKEFDEVFTKDFSKFHKLELLVSRIAKALHGEDAENFVYLIKCWSSVDDVRSSVVQNLVDSGAGSDHICSALFGARKSYHASKLTESLKAKEANIRSAIDRRMVSFKVNKGHMIRSVLERLFYKMVLDHLVVDDDLIWKCHMADDVLIDWHYQYQPLEYVFDEIFSGFDEFFKVVSDLSDDKAAGLFGISNELWKHCNKSVLDMLLVILNFCLSDKLCVLTNTCPIALIKTACKILSKILSDRISLACSAFDVFHGDNFSVLKGTTTQSLIFTIGSVVEDALEKNQKLWLVMTDFGLTNNYHVKCQKSICEYRLNSYFISKNGHVKSCAGHSSFFVAGVFVDDIIWVGSSQSTTQHILNIASEFFRINDILINNDKTVVIPINSRVNNPSLFISGLPISITKKGKSYRYLNIFLSTESLFKPSLVRAHSDVHFFTNLMLRKAVSDKQFLYLVLVVLHPIVSYRTQFSFVLDLKLKSGLLLDFPSDTIHHPFFYGLKSFLQYQFEGKVALLISFANSGKILGTCSVTDLMTYRSSVGNLSIHWFSLLLIWFTFFSTASYLWVALWPAFSGFTVEYLYLLFLLHDHFGSVFSWHTFKKWKRLNPHGPVPDWFDISVVFLVAPYSFLLALAGVGPLDIHGSNDFISVCDHLFRVDTDSLSVYTDGSVKNLGIIGCRARTAVFLRTLIWGLISSTLVELQTIALALECMPVAHSVHLFSDSQAALDACRLEFNLMYPDFCNQCWVKCQHIRNVIRRPLWYLRDNYANSLVDTAFLSGWYFSPCVDEHFLLADGGVVSGNSRHFVHDVFHAVYGDLCLDVNWLCFSRVWHSDLHMATGFTSRLTADTRTYLIKAFVLCLYCDEVEVSNHVFSCVVDDSARCQVLESCMSSWRVLSGLSLPFLGVLQLLSICALNFPVFSALYKSFVFNKWLREAISIFHDPKVASIKISDFVRSICFAFRNDIWLVCAKYHAFMEKNGLIPVDGSISILVSGLVLVLSAGVIKLLGIAEAFGVHFGFHKSCLFFSGIDDPVSVNISV